MNLLPDELVLQILQYLKPQELAVCQSISRRYLTLARDTTLWKELCYNVSLAEYARARWQADQTSSGHRTVVSRERCRHNWDPGYPGETIDYYEEFMHQHVGINVVWKTMPGYSQRNDEIRELTGLALLDPSDAAGSHAVCAVDDGSILVYDLCSQSISQQVSGHSGPGLLTPGAPNAVVAQQWMTKSNSVDVVSIDAHRTRGYFAVNNLLHEVDLNQLSLISTKPYNASISALSAQSNHQPLLIGSSNTIHVFDDRDKHFTSHTDTADQLDLNHTISCSQHYITLPDPGPSSILLAPDNDTVWVAGRFKSLLQYSLRYFPRLKSSIFSGAHISCLTSYPFTHIGRQWDLLENTSMPVSAYAARRAMSGWTIVGAGVYKGKGSLELYTTSPGPTTYETSVNRQSVSSSKLLSVAMHGSKLVYSDGNAQLTWMDRNGYTFKRMHRIGTERPQQPVEDRNSNPLLGLWETMDDSIANSGDIVQKIIPYHGGLTSSGRRPENLLLWSGDGRLGFLGFGSIDAFQADEYYDALETQAQTAADKAHHDAERQYALAMRRALQRNADEVRFMRGLGMAAL